MVYEARYTFTLLDYRAIYRAVASRHRFGRYTTHLYLALYLAAMVVVFEIGMPVVLGAPFELPTAQALAFHGGIIVVFLVIYEVLLRWPWLMSWQYQRLAIADQPVTLRLGPDGIDTSSPGLTGRLEWPAIRALVAGPDQFVLLISRMEGIVLPKRGFDTPADYEAALALARDNVRSNRA
jgi:hypothetical protein